MKHFNSEKVRLKVCGKGKERKVCEQCVKGKINKGRKKGGRKGRDKSVWKRKRKKERKVRKQRRKEKRQNDITISYNIKLFGGKKRMII